MGRQQWSSGGVTQQQHLIRCGPRRLDEQDEHAATIAWRARVCVWLTWCGRRSSPRVCCGRRWALPQPACSRGVAAWAESRTTCRERAGEKFSKLGRLNTEQRCACQRTSRRACPAVSENGSISRSCGIITTKFSGQDFPRKPWLLQAETRGYRETLAFLLQSRKP